MEVTGRDLEGSSAYSGLLSGYLSEIIQFGAVRLSEKLEKRGEFTTFVRPQEGKKLTELVEQLTNISNDDLSEGLPFLEAFDQFARFMRGSVLLTWGTCDIRELLLNYEFYKGRPVLPFECEYINLQAYCQQCWGQESAQQIGLAAAARQLGADLEGMELHRAIDDSILAARCFQKTYDAQKLSGFLNRMDERFCRRIAFRNKAITDLKHPAVKQSQLEFTCPVCRRPMTLSLPWELHGKQFSARFSCHNCEKKYIAHVSFKLKYDGVAVRRNLSEERAKPAPAPVGGKR